MPNNVESFYVQFQRLSKRDKTIYIVVLFSLVVAAVVVTSTITTNVIESTIGSTADMLIN